jgi:hypothetical protein
MSTRSVVSAVLAAALALGFGWTFSRTCAPRAGEAPGPAPPPSRAELDALRSSVAEQAAALGALSDELAILRGEVASLAAVLPAPPGGDALAADAGEGDPEDPHAADADAAGEAAGAASAPRPSFDAASLVAAGYPAREAERLRERWERLTLDRLELNNRALREGWLREPRLQEEQRALDVAFREDVGEDGYDAFLYATGQPNRVRVREVIARSPASHAGMQPGDLIVSYDGERTFGARDLQLATAEGRRGDLVRVEVVRDGRPLTLRVERGPLGIILQGSAEPPRSAG